MKQRILILLAQNDKNVCLVQVTEFLGVFQWLLVCSELLSLPYVIFFFLFTCYK